MLYFGKTRLAIGQNKFAVHVLRAAQSMLIGVQEDSSLVSDSRLLHYKVERLRPPAIKILRIRQAQGQDCGQVDYHAGIKGRPFAALGISPLG
jgi:hypothetical protein